MKIPMGRPKSSETHVAKIVATKLNHLLASRGMTQTQLSDETGIPKQTINGYVRGTSLPTPVNTEKLAALFNVRADEIDPRLSMFDNYDIERAKDILHKAEKELLMTIIDKIQSLNNIEREKYVDKLRFAVLLLEQKDK